MRFEFHTFEQNHIGDHPHPTEADGLPEGWQVCWHAIYPPALTEVDGTDFEVFVVHRLTGGWGLVFHETKLGALKTTLSELVAVTLHELYARTLEETKRGPGSTGAEREVREFITSYYDPADPLEAAEATLVGLGAPIMVFPAALAEQ